MHDLSASESLTDRIWRGYDIRAMLPHAAIAGVLTLALMIERWLSEDLSLVAERVGILFIYVPLAVLWAALLSIGLYRSITYTYRLTDGSLLIDRGFRWPPVRPLALREIVDVQVSRTPPTSWLNIGRVVVVSATGRRIEMTGVRAPEVFAEGIRQEVRRAVGGPMDSASTTKSQSNR